MRILYVTTVCETFVFFESFIKGLIDEGHTVDIATNNNDSEIQIVEELEKYGCRVFHMDWDRYPLALSNVTSIRELKKIISNNNYDIVHCHTPVASACTRLACKSLRKSGVRVIYTAHGFHFFKGSSKLSWLVWYNIEKLCSRWTDVLITINHEDYKLANNKFYTKHIEYIPGVGIDVEHFATTVVNKSTLRSELSIPDDAFVIMSVGELNDNKNHQVVLRAIANTNNNNIHYIVVGRGPNGDGLEHIAEEMNISKQLHVLGYRHDVDELYKISDVYALPSLREGLNVSVMEAMASGLPCMVSKIRGNVDLVNDECGWLFDPENLDEVTSILNNMQAETLSEKSHFATIKSEMYDSKQINTSVKAIYSKFCENKNK